MIETETKKRQMGHHKKHPLTPLCKISRVRPSVRPRLFNVRPRFFNVRPRFSMSVRGFFNVRPSVSIVPAENNQKSTKIQNDPFKKRRQTAIRYFRIAICTLFSYSDLHNASFEETGTDR